MTFAASDSLFSREVALPSQSTLADLLGASRQSVNEALGDLESQGIIETGYRMIRALDRQRLGTIVGRSG